MSIGDNIKKYRKQKGLTQRELAEAIGVSVQAISKWECGATPDISQILPLAVALDASANELLGYADQMKEIDDGWYAILRDHGEGSLVAIEYEKKVLSEFPNDLTYGYRLATDYHIHSQMCEEPQEKHYYLQLAKNQFTKLLEKDPTDEIVRSCLVDVCMSLSEKEKAMQYVMESRRKDELLRLVYEGEERIRHNQELIDRKFLVLLKEMSRSEDVEVLCMARNMIKAAFPDENYQRYRRHLVNFSVRIAGQLTRVGRYDDAMKELRALWEFEKEQMKFRDTECFTTPLFDRLDVHKEYREGDDGEPRYIWIAQNGGYGAYLHSVLTENGLFYPYLSDREDFRAMLAELDKMVQNQKGRE